MTERLRSGAAGGAAAGYHCQNGANKMEHDLLSPRKTMLVVVIVVGCFAVLWPKVFYPMLVGSANQHIKPSSIDKTTGCCDVISETDYTTIKVMSELCATMIKTEDGDGRKLSDKEVVQRCRQEVLDTCGIDMSAVLQQQVRLGQNVKQIIDEVRSLNGSLCLKYNFGVAPWRLGVPHRVLTVKMAPASNIRQERPLHLRSELIHPAFRERGRAIPQPQIPQPVRPAATRVIDGRPGPLPGMRPTIGGAGHVVPPPKQGTGSMGVIMPIYTIGIVIFFTYTLVKIIFKQKQPESVGGSLYPPIDPDPHFRKEVFDSDKSRLGRMSRESISSKLVVNAMSALLEEVDQELEARRKTNEVASQDLLNGSISNGNAPKPQDSDEQAKVKVMGMEMRASCEGGQKWTRPDSPLLPSPSPPPPEEPLPPPQEIYLEGTLPPESHLLVTDSAAEPQTDSANAAGEDPAVILSGKMTLSVVSLDSSDNGDGGAKVEPGYEKEQLVEEPEYDKPKAVEPDLLEEPELVELDLVEPKLMEPEVMKPLMVEPDLVETKLETQKLTPEPQEPKASAPEPNEETDETEPVESKESRISFKLSEDDAEEEIREPAAYLDSQAISNLEVEMDTVIQEALENIKSKEDPEEDRVVQFSEEAASDGAESNEAEIGSDDEEIEEEEIEYEVSDEEDESDHQASNKSDSAGQGRLNGGGSGLTEESRYTSASSATAAENDISEEEVTDEEVDDEEEIIEIEEVDEEEEDDEDEEDEELAPSGNANHVLEESEED